jgi:hypothetical protein
MSSNTDYCNLFDKQFKILLEDLKQMTLLYTKNTEYYNILNDYTKKYILKKIFYSNDYLIKLFYTYITQIYSSHIKEQNEAFLLEFDYNQHLDKEVLSTINENNYTDTIIKIVDLIKNIWQSEITEEHKNVIWTRLNVCVKLTEKWNTGK